MRSLIRVLLFGFLCGVVWGMILNERQHRQEHEAKVRAFENDPEVIALNKEWEREDNARRWTRQIEEEIDDDEG